MTLMIYSLLEKRWRRVEHTSPAPGNAGRGGALPVAPGVGDHHPMHIAMGGGMEERGAAAAAAAAAANRADRDGSGGRSGFGGGVLPPGRLFVSGTPPPGRNGHTATLATTGSGENARIVIIGGWLGTGPLAAHDMHVLDISGGVESLRWYQPVSHLTVVALVIILFTHFGIVLRYKRSFYISCVVF